VEIRTQRLLLRPWRPEDAADVAAAMDIYHRDDVTRWLGSSERSWATEDSARDRLVRWVEVSSQHPGLGLWAVVPDGVGSPVGTVLLVQLSDADGELTDDVEVGWHFHPEHWGNGYATEAAAALLEHAFGTLGLTEVNAIAYPGNEPSFAVMRRLGMVHRGATDRWYGATMEWWSVSR
jgi:RimJ/RimL family protein N-acetyltransferase